MSEVFKYQNRLKKIKGKSFDKLTCSLNEIIPYPPIYVRFVVNMAYPKQPFGIMSLHTEDGYDLKEIILELHAGMIDMGYEEDSFEEAVISYLTSVYSENN